MLPSPPRPDERCGELSIHAVGEEGGDVPPGRSARSAELRSSHTRRYSLRGRIQGMLSEDSSRGRWRLNVLGIPSGCCPFHRGRWSWPEARSGQRERQARKATHPLWVNCRLPSAHRRKRLCSRARGACRVDGGPADVAYASATGGLGAEKVSGGHASWAGKYVRRPRGRARRSGGRWRRSLSLPWGDGGECEKREEEERQGRGDGGRQNKLTLGDSSGAEHGGGEPRGSRIWHGLARLRLR